MASFAPRASWNRFRHVLAGDGLKGRLMRGGTLTVANLGGGQVMRLAANLALTRLLFPEAFGMMALVQVVLTGLLLLSDTGLNVSVIQNARGDDRDFLDTVWTVKVVRGVVLWLIACGLAVPVARLYDEPMIAQLLPVMGLTLILKGALPTAINTAHRHIRLGRVTVVKLCVQALGLGATILLAWWLESVWALAWGAILTALLKQAMTRAFLPDSRNRFHWDPEIVRELFHFGKWILLGTFASYLVNNVDKMILGAFVSLEELGIYRIGIVLAMLSYGVVGALKGKLLMPLYRMRPMRGRPANRRKVFFMRRLIAGGGIAATALLALVAVPLVDLLYDDRYALAGPIVALFCLSLIPRIITMGAGDLLLVAGDSWRAMHLTVALAVVQVPIMWFAVSWFGIGGAIVAPAVAVVLTHPLRVRYARLYEGWDGWGELVLLVVGLSVTGWACWQSAEAIAPLFR
ncbi:MAG: oligosaccharide flippase family protein [Shimia sp.]